MRTHTKTTIGALLATIALALALTATTASARSFSINEREVEILFRSLSFNGGGNSISCPITLLGHFFERTIAKVNNSNVGVINHASPLNDPRPPCSGGTITILNESLPWRVGYQGFTGRLPNIERTRESLIGAAFRISTGSLGCLAGFTALKPAAGELRIGTGGRVEEFIVDPNTRIPLGGSFICSFAGESEFSGVGTVLNLPGTRPLTVTLI